MYYRLNCLVIAGGTKHEIIDEPEVNDKEDFDSNIYENGGKCMGSNLSKKELKSCRNIWQR